MLQTEFHRYTWYSTKFEVHEKSRKSAESLKEQITNEIHLLNQEGMKDLEFLWEAYYAIILCWNTLKWSFVYAYFKEKKMSYA